MNLFSCFKCQTEHEVDIQEIQEIQDPTNEIQDPTSEAQEQNTNKYFETHTTYDKNNRKFSYTIYNKNLFRKFGVNKISETNIYTLNDPEKIAITIKLYDHGHFHIDRLVDNINSYVLIDEDREMNSYLAQFVENNNNDRIKYFALFSPYTPEEYSSTECPEDGFKIIVSEDKKKHVYECGRLIGN